MLLNFNKKASFVSKTFPSLNKTPKIIKFKQQQESQIDLNLLYCKGKSRFLPQLSLELL